jgi:hypothetical protein
VRQASNGGLSRKTRPVICPGDGRLCGEVCGPLVVIWLECSGSLQGPRPRRRPIRQPRKSRTARCRGRRADGSGAAARLAAPRRRTGLPAAKTRDSSRRRLPNIANVTVHLGHNRRRTEPPHEQSSALRPTTRPELGSSLLPPTCRPLRSLPPLRRGHHCAVSRRHCRAGSRENSKLVGGQLAIARCGPNADSSGSRE